MSMPLDADDAGGPAGRGDRRAAPRVRLDAPYTQVRLRRVPDEGGDHAATAEYLSGHAYDLSLTGTRVELDHPLAVGEEVGIELALPGDPSARVEGRGKVVRRHDPDEVGPVRMGIAFTQVDQPALEAYLKRFADHRQ